MLNHIFTIQKITQVLFTGSLVLILLALAATGVFLYVNFYKIILQTEEIIIIQTETYLEPVNIAALNQILLNLTAKAEGSKVLISSIKNPF